MFSELGSAAKGRAMPTSSATDAWPGLSLSLSLSLCHSGPSFDSKPEFRGRLSLSSLGRYPCRHGPGNPDSSCLAVKLSLT